MPRLSEEADVPMPSELSSAPDLPQPGEEYLVSKEKVDFDEAEERPMFKQFASV